MIRSITILLLTLIQLEADSLLKNSTFDQKLTPWACEEGKIVADPDNKENQVLRITLDDGVFDLSQALDWPKKSDALVLSFRVRASQADEENPIQLRVRLYNQEGSSAVTQTLTIAQPDTWLSFTQSIDRPDFEVVSFSLESNRGEGQLWLDDLILK